MKKILLVCVCLFWSSNTFAAMQQDEYAAGFLAEKGIIQTSSDYKLNSLITRREMLKVMMNLSGKEISQTCEGKFVDMNASDWGCKYAEAALAHGYIAANEYFRPNDTVTEFEALKMIVNARGISVYESEWYTSWEEKYISGVYHLLGEGGSDEKWGEKIIASYDKGNTSVNRKAVFLLTARTFDEFILDMSHWRELNYTSGDCNFLVKYPENWFYKDWSISVSFSSLARHNPFDGNRLQCSEEDVSSLVEKAKTVSERWEFSSQTQEEMFTDSGLKVVKVSTTQIFEGSEYGSAYVTFIVEGKNGMNYTFDVYEDEIFDRMINSFDEQ